MNIDEDENLILEDENLVPKDENFILDVVENVITLIANFANVFKNILTVFQNLFVQVCNCSFLKPEDKRFKITNLHHDKKAATKKISHRGHRG
jgi:hypothetical protein